MAGTVGVWVERAPARRYQRTSRDYGENSRRKLFAVDFYPSFKVSSCLQYAAGSRTNK